MPEFVQLPFSASDFGWPNPARPLPLTAETQAVLVRVRPCGWPLFDVTNLDQAVRRRFGLT